MTQFTKEDLLGIAKLSALELNNHEIDLLTNQVKSIIAYVDQLQEAVITEDAPAYKNQNIFRDDTALPNNSEDILSQSPERDETYFVVPKILE